MASDGTDATTAPPPLAALLRGWRQRALLTQQQLAGRARLSARTIRRLESSQLRASATRSGRC
jgi:transcriptional regulator with XRE-family HTH domain